MRQYRRSIDHRQRPSPEEIEACETAYELDSTNSEGSVVAMSRLYTELLICCERGSRDHQNVSGKAIEIAR